LDPFKLLNLVPPLFLYFLLFVSKARGVGVVSMLPALEMGEKPPLFEMGIASLSLVV
jgi:hypothetical protein